METIADDRETIRTSFQAEENISLAEGAIISCLMYIAGVGGSALLIASIDKNNNLFLASAIGVTATIIGIILAIMLGRYHQKYIDYQLRKGGLILWVQLENKSQANDVIKILEYYNAAKVKLHSYAHNS